MAKTSSATTSNHHAELDHPPDLATTFRFLDADYPIKLGDIFMGVPTVSINPPLSTLDPSIDIEEAQNGQEAGKLLVNPPIPEGDDPGYGPIIGAPRLGGQSYAMMVSHTCDYYAKVDNVYRRLCPIYPLVALPDSNGLRGFVWGRPYSGPAAYHPLPPIGQHPTLLGQEHLPFPTFVNLRHITDVHLEVLKRSPRIASLTQPAKHLLLRKVGALHAGIRLRLDHFAAEDAKYPSDLERP